MRRYIKSGLPIRLLSIGLLSSLIHSHDSEGSLHQWFSLQEIAIVFAHRVLKKLSVVNRLLGIK